MKLSAGRLRSPRKTLPMKQGQTVYVLGRYRAKVVDITPQSITVDVYEGLAPGQKAPQRGTFAKELIHHDEIVAKPWWRPKSHKRAARKLVCKKCGGEGHFAKNLQESAEGRCSRRRTPGQRDPRHREGGTVARTCSLSVTVSPR
jgi:hypothetical protein